MFEAVHRRIETGPPRFAAGLMTIAVVVAAVVSGCLGPDAADVAKARERADAVLARWADAVATAGGPSRVVPVGDLTGQLGDWEPDVGDNNKRALMAGLVAGVDSVPSDTPPDAEVTLEDGTAVIVPVLSADQALAAMRMAHREACGDCSELWVTGARLTSGAIETSRGPATAPIWEFTLRDTAVKAT